jgi:hypothetical protein
VTSADGYSGEVAAGNSVTAHAKWVKSSYSAQNGNCVEVAALSPGKIGVRDSKDRAPGGPVLVFSDLEWQFLLKALRSGELDI